MSNPFTIIQDDVGLIELFKDFETIITDNKAEIDWFATTDFRVFSEYLVKDIQEMQQRLKDPDDEYLYYVCQHIFNIQDWIRLYVEDAGLSTFASFVEILFDERFGDKYILKNIYDNCFENWVSQKTGQYEIGENFYNILKSRLYYRNRFGRWFEVERATAFDLKPNKVLVEDKDTIEQLNSGYKETWYDAIIKRWENKQYQGVLPDDFLQFSDKTTSPDEYLDFTITRIKTLLENPVSIAELERWNGREITDLEHIVKVAAYVQETARKRRSEDSHTVYLLRDCLMFHEAHKTLNILNGKDTSSDQILIGRKLLSHKPEHWGYYSVLLDALYNAHLRYPSDFTEFYNEFARLMDMFVSLNPKFAALIVNLTDYVKEHIRTDKDKIDIFDTGFQGSINLLTKYIIDRHISPSEPNGKIETDIKIGVGAQWSKKLFGYRYDGDYFPLLYRLQLMTRSNELYHYKEGSLQSGELQVVMGDKEAQHGAAIELVVLVMVALITQEDH